MVGEQIEEWRDPSPVTSDDGGSLSDESTSYQEEVPTQPIEKKHRTEEDEDPNYTPTVDRPSKGGSRTPQPEQADDEARVSKLLIQCYHLMTSFSLKYETNVSSCARQIPVVPMCLEYPED